MVRRVMMFLGFVLAMYLTVPVEAGSISGSTRNLDGTPIGDQNNQTLSITVTLAQGDRAALTIARNAQGVVERNDPRINLTVAIPDANDPDKITWTVTFSNNAFVRDQQGRFNFAVTVDVRLSGRDAPGAVNNVIGNSDRTVLHLAFPELPPAAPYIYSVQECLSHCQCVPHCRWFGRFRRW